MPGIYIATTTDYPNGVVSVRCNDGTSYNQIQNSLGSTIYDVKEIYIKASSYNQILQPINFQRYDANGNIKIFNQISAIDPNQKQSALSIDMTNKKMTLDGNIFITLPLLPLEHVFLYLDVDESTLATMLSEDMFDVNDFFNRFKDKINYER